MQKKFLGIALFCAATALFSCTQDPLKDFDCAGSTPTYTTDIAPIMAANCTGCHGTTSPSDNLDLTTYAKVKAEGDLFCSVNYDNGCESMPKGGAKLSDADIKKIACWINNGYKE